jgi:hypothetical protein
MAQHDPALKGKFGGNCNRTACQVPGADWWNPNTNAYYCCDCAVLINRNIPLVHSEWRLVRKESGNG